MKLCLFDGRAHKDLLPLTFTRPVSEIRLGVYTIKEKWENLWGEKVGRQTISYLSNVFENLEEEKVLYVSAAVLPTPALVDAIKGLEKRQKLVYHERVLAFQSSWQEFNACKLEEFETVYFEGKVNVLENAGHIFEYCADEIESDLKFVGIQATNLWKSNTVFGERLYISEGAVAKACTFNTETGPIFIGKNAQILEGSHIRGPFVLGEHSVVKMAAKIYGPTSIGPHCKIGGELSNVVMFGYSNKGHDGFLGNSVIGEWCNLGADTNTSNLKNNYGLVKAWSYETERLEPTNRQFQGLIMGDHSKTSINTMLNTGTTIGAFANIFGPGFPEKFVPSFTWGGKEEFKLEKAFEVAERMMKRRDISLSDLNKEIIRHIFKLTRKYRT